MATEILAAALPGVEVLDHDLELDDGQRVAFAGADGSGRLVLGILGTEDADAVALAVLDTLALGRRLGAVLARHLGAERIRPDLPPRVVVLVTPGSGHLVARLVGIAAAGVEVLEIRTIRSQGGEGTYLAPASSAEEERPPPGPPPGPEAFLEALPDPLSGLGRALVDRMERLDEDLRIDAAADALSWSFRGKGLVRLELHGDRLRASVAPDHRPRPLRGLQDVDEVLEEALGRLVEGMRPAAELAGVGSAVAVGGFEPLLTEEELEAFRD